MLQSLINNYDKGQGRNAQISTNSRLSMENYPKPKIIEIWALK